MQVLEITNNDWGKANNCFVWFIKHDRLLNCYLCMFYRQWLKIIYYTYWTTTQRWLNVDPTSATLAQQ